MEMWLAAQPTKRKTVPPKIKRALAKMAIAHVVGLWEKRIQAGNRRGAKDFRTPSVDPVMEYARRRGPTVSLRDKKRQPMGPPRQRPF
jgi:hypothetical protein